MMSLGLPPHEEKAVRQYVEAECRDPDDPDDSDWKVTLVQKVHGYRLFGTDYEIYDVHTLKSRWWVITDPMNLYSQSDFPSYDYAFSFHVGLTIRMGQRDQSAMEDNRRSEHGAAWLKYDDALEAMDSAREAEDYQAVAIRCREALLAFAQEYQTADWVEVPDPAPKRGDFKGWTSVYAQALAGGRTRTYLSDVAGKTWDLTVALQHDSNIASWDADLLLAAIDHVFDMFTICIAKMTREQHRRCPKCGSYRFGMDGGIAARQGTEGWEEREVCSRCGYRGESTFRPWEDSELPDRRDDDDA